MAFSQTAFAVPLAVTSARYTLPTHKCKSSHHEHAPLHPSSSLPRATLRGRDQAPDVQLREDTSLSSAPYAPCVPAAAAAQIQDPNAQYMLRSLQYTPVQTTLPQQTILTSHVSATPSSPAVRTKLLFLHGFDSNMLEYRFVLPKLQQAIV